MRQPVRSLVPFLLLVLAAALLAPSCRPPRVEILSPGALVETPAVLIEVNAPSDTFDFDPATDVTLNGQIIVVTGPGPVYTASVGPGAPLMLDNILRVGTHLLDGRPSVKALFFRYEPPRALARRIDDPADLPQGPLADGRIGDFLLENDVARFVVQDATPLGPGGVSDRDLYSVGQYGGNVVDAELKAHPGRESFLEIQPSLNVESVVNAQSVEIVNDGFDGTPAVVRACGPDDLLDFANPSSFLLGTSFIFPPLADDRDLEMEGCTEYRLAPGATHLEIETTVFNNQPVGANPANLPLLVGDWVNAGGELEAWTAPSPGLGPGLTGGGTGFGLLSWFGYGEAAGVDYALSPLRTAGLETVASDYFYTSGVNVLIHHGSVIESLLGVPPRFVVPQFGSRSYRRLLGVGDGSGANAVALQAQASGLTTGLVSGCVTVAGTPSEGARVAIGTTDATGAINGVVSSFVTRAGPCPNYGGAVPAGSFGAAAGRAGTLYEGGAPTPPVHPVSVTAGATTPGLDFDLPAPGQVAVQVTDASDAPVPARITVVGFDPSPEPLLPGLSIPGFGSATHGIFQDPTDRLPFGLVRVAYAEADGSVAFDLEPGVYELVVSRGTEYSAFRTPLSVTAGATTTVQAQIAPVLDTTGFVSSDFHVHGVRSPDSRVSDRDRVYSFAAEGIENPVMTDHHAHADLRPTIQAMGMQGFLTATVGEEITTFDYGHFNAYPFLVDPTLPSGGATDWARPAPPGMDFPAYGAFNATPTEIHALAVAGDLSLPGVTTIQVNHISSHFEPLQIDTGLPGPISDGLGAAERQALRLPASGNLFHPFPALELWNGNGRSHQNQFLAQRIGIWFNHLNKGLMTTAIADTDTHTFTNLNTAGARSWTASPTGDAPAAIQSGDVAGAVDAGRLVGGQGIYVQARLVAQDGSNGVADLTATGSTLVTSANGAVDLEIVVQAPPWAPFDRIEVYANAGTEPVNPAAPYLYRPAPGSALTLLEGDCDPATTGDGDFDVSLVAVAAVPGGDRLEVQHVVSFPALVEDTWFVVVARGTDGVCAPMFPVYPDDLSTSGNTTLANLLDGNVGELGVMSLGHTNALYADVDGVPGFQAPGP